MKQSTYLCVILHVKHKKLPILAFFAGFLIIGKIQGGGQDGDQASQASTTHKNNKPHPVKKIKDFPLKVKSIPITATYQKL